MKSGAVDLIRNTLKSLLKCKQNGEALSKQAPPSIYMVPKVVRDLSPSSFTPRVVAIGPLHRKDEHLQAFEVQKTAYLHNLLHRLRLIPEKTLQKCAEQVIFSIERIKECYAESPAYDDLELAKMMVLDACFILEFILVSSERLPSRTNLSIIGSIGHDLLLLENQIPFFVLEIIFECTVLASVRTREGTSLKSHMEVLQFYYYQFIQFEGNPSVPPEPSAPDHILGFVHESFRPAEPMPSMSASSIKGHSAMDLDRAGMNFKPHTKDQNWVLAMKLEFPLPLFPWLHNFKAIPQFSWFQGPTLRIPKVHIGDGSELVFRNLIAYEQSSDVQKYVTTYAFAMDMLIDTPEDVALLVKSGVLHDHLGSNQEASEMINKLCKNIMYPDIFYREWEEMDTYYNSYWPLTVAELKRKYFNNPWSILALAAAFLLFALTATQTIFTIKAA